MLQCVTYLSAQTLLTSNITNKYKHWLFSGHVVIHIFLNILKYIHYITALCYFCLLKTRQHGSLLLALRHIRQTDRTTSQSFWVKVLCSKPSFSSVTSIHKSPKCCNLLILGVDEDLGRNTEYMVILLYGKTVCAELALVISTNSKCWEVILSHFKLYHCEFFPLF